MRKFEFNSTIEKAEEDGANWYIWAVASDNLRDFQADKFTENALTSMVKQAKMSGTIEGDEDGLIELRETHKSVFGFGQVVDGFLENDPDGTVRYIVKIKLDQDFPQAKSLFKAIKKGKVRKQLSIGGEVPEREGVITYAKDGSKITRVLHDVELEHIATTLSKKAANDRTKFMTEIFKSIDAEDKKEETIVVPTVILDDPVTTSDSSNYTTFVVNTTNDAVKNVTITPTNMKIEKPYSGPDDKGLPDNIKKMPTHARKIFAAAFNSALSSCQAKSGSNCESRAFAIATSAANKFAKKDMSEDDAAAICEMISQLEAVLESEGYDPEDMEGEDMADTADATDKYASWDGSKSRFTTEQLIHAVPAAIAEWARSKAKQEGKPEVPKEYLKLPYKEPGGAVNLDGVRNALARLPQVQGIPQEVLSAAREELERVLHSHGGGEANKSEETMTKKEEVVKNEAKTETPEGVLSQLGNILGRVMNIGKTEEPKKEEVVETPVLEETLVGVVKEAQTSLESLLKVQKEGVEEARKKAAETVAKLNAILNPATEPNGNEFAEKFLDTVLNGVTKNIEGANASLLQKLNEHTANSVLKSVETMSVEFATKVLEKSAGLEGQITKLLDRVDKIEKIEGASTKDGEVPSPKDMKTPKKDKDTFFGLREQYRNILGTKTE